MTEVSDHGKSYRVAPLDGSQDKLRNCRFLKPKEPSSYELSCLPERSNSLPDVNVDQGEAPPATRSKSAEDLKNVDCEKRIRSSQCLKDFANKFLAPWDQSPAANTRSRKR